MKNIITKPSSRIILAMIIWGSIGLFVREISLPPLEIAFLRAVIASLTLGLVRLFYKRKASSRNKKPKHIIVLLLSGIFLAINWVCLFMAYKYTTLANATLSYYIAPVIAVALAPFVIINDRLTIRKIVSILAGLSGLFFILNQQQFTYTTGTHIRGLSFGIIAAFMYAGVIICNKKITNLSPINRVTYQMIISALVLLPLIIDRNNLVLTNSKSVVIILLLGVLHTGIAYMLYFPSIEHVSIIKSSILSYIDPLMAVIFGALFLNEQISTNHLFGGFLIMLGAFVSERKIINKIEQ